LRRRLLISLLVLGALLVGLWAAIQRVPGFGSWLADTGRSVVGPRPVAWVEDWAYGVEDWVNRQTRSGEKPVAYWEVPSANSKAGSAKSKRERANRLPGSGRPQFELAAVGPVHDSFSAPGDGSWVPMTDALRPDAPAVMLKTLLHPDRSRSWAVVAVVAVDLGQAELHPVAGLQEPESRTPEAKGYNRKGLIDPGDHSRLLAAFNGGYKSTHGYYGMKIDGITLVPPRSLCCVIAAYDDGRLAIRSWEAVSADEPSMRWWRQAPVCMYENGKANPVLNMPGFGWGASSVSGTTVIRRSAMGLDASGKVLFVGIGDFTTATAIADAMHHAGAANVAQLDVNFSFPKFVTYEPRSAGSSDLLATPLTQHFEYTEDDYIRKPAERDFFYLTRRAADAS